MTEAHATDKGWLLDMFKVLIWAACADIMAVCVSYSNAPLCMCASSNDNVFQLI